MAEPIWFDPAEMPTGDPVVGWRGRFFSSPHVTFGLWDVADGAAPVHEHSHPEEEVWIVVEGSLEVTVAGDQRTVQPGGAVFIPGGVMHAVRSRGRARAIAADHPARAQLPGSTK